MVLAELVETFCAHIWLENKSGRNLIK